MFSSGAYRLNTSVGSWLRSRILPIECIRDMKHRILNTSLAVAALVLLPPYHPCMSSRLETDRRTEEIKKRQIQEWR
jgi:hypothetical protein